MMMVDDPEEGTEEITITSSGTAPDGTGARSVEDMAAVRRSVPAAPPRQPQVRRRRIKGDPGGDRQGRRRGSGGVQAADHYAACPQCRRVMSRDCLTRDAGAGTYGVCRRCDYGNQWAAGVARRMRRR